ncbi:tetraacyldisaccharide 4'-kinase [Variovorax sp. J22R133]|uniref:tetraacyldisaccharide 4'-kinase n=1 Tax=Variovorax brevis TaxID=3053503 RepID=UPI002576F246|nr:tetraacyldisaccharide 4'-kinase [Variovorax sp. J22R133]MDM0112437.1 tetraacyldisaccharide 4'-kinase [Variovorax sp. J22R133]
MALSLQRVWLERGALAWLLLPVSLLFGALAGMRRALFRMGLLRTERVSVPVVIVGNVIAGGAGKTPSVMAIVEHLQARGKRVGVISRGYGRTTSDCREVLSSSSPADVGDEPALVQRKTGAPAFVARKRIEAARALLARYPQTQVIVSDDGLQHTALARDVEICVFDDRGIGNGWLLPAGPLRETWPRACDLVLHTGERAAFAGFRAQRALADHAVGRDAIPVSLASLAGRRIVAVAAIAKPESFFQMLRNKGVTLERTIALPDHDDFQNWTPLSASGLTVLCTEKDAAKLWRVEPHALAVALVFEPEPAFFTALDAKLSSLDGYQAA